MNLTQKKYAMDRVNSIIIGKENELRLQCEGMEYEPSNKEMIREINYGNVSLKRGCKITDTLLDAFDFSDILGKTLFDKAKWNKLCTPFRKKAGKVRDEIMLGNEAKALVLIKEFIKEAG